MKVSERKVDPKKKEEGAWVSNIPGWGDLRLKVKGVGNRQWANMEQTLINAVPRKQRINGLDPVERDRINGILLRDASLIDWDNMEDDDGKPQPYDKALASTYLTDPVYEEFRGAVLWAATVVAEQGEAEIEDDAKN